jgi:transcription-repair coupling factor (superfamily II helicase)
MSSLSAVDEFAVELRDRYGPPPRQVLLLLDVTRLRILARKAGIHRIAVRNGKAILETERGLLKRSTGGVPELVAEDGPGQVAELQALIRKHVPAHEVE